MISAIFQAIGTVITQFAQVIGNGFSSLVSIFYDSEGLTLVGTLAIIGAGVGLVYWAFGLIRNFIAIRRG